MVCDMSVQQPVQILIVDDHPDNLVAVEAVLSPLGHRILRAESGRAALRILLQEEVALVLLDVAMADMDGYEVAELIHGRSFQTVTELRQHVAEGRLTEAEFAEINKFLAENP